MIFMIEKKKLTYFFIYLKYGEITLPSFFFLFFFVLKKYFLAYYQFLFFFFSFIFVYF